jgi:hypothetical protein
MKLLKKYYIIQKSKGISFFAATLLLPRKILNQFSLRIVKRQINELDQVRFGFSRFDLPLRVTYPRSGTNWIRFFLEICSNKPTPGDTRYHTGEDYLIDRAHCGYPIMNKYNKVILILRNYKECLIREKKANGYQRMMCKYS